MSKGPAPVTAQAWVALRTEDPEAASALAVARRTMAAGRDLAWLRRLRLFELCGPLPGRAGLEDLLHRSIQFYNPHKESCQVRMSVIEPAPVEEGARVVAVFERGGLRRPAAERWWVHETGSRVQVREAVAWVLGFSPGAEATRIARELTVLREPARGLLCNPHAQQHRISGAVVPMPWLSGGRTAAPRRLP